MGTKKHKPFAVADLNGVIVARVPVPRGTVLDNAQVHTQHGVCVFTFRVKWYVLPFYLARAMWGTIKQGMKVQVHSRFENHGTIITPAHIRENTPHQTTTVH